MRTFKTKKKRFLQNYVKTVCANYKKRFCHTRIGLGLRFETEISDSDNTVTILLGLGLASQIPAKWVASNSLSECLRRRPANAILGLGKPRDRFAGVAAPLGSCKNYVKTVCKLKKNGLRCLEGLLGLSLALAWPGLEGSGGTGPRTLGPW